MTADDVSKSLQNCAKKIVELLDAAKAALNDGQGKCKIIWIICWPKFYFATILKILPVIFVFFQQLYLEEFLNKNLGSKLGPGIGVLATLFQELNIGNLTLCNKLVLSRLLAEMIFADSWDRLEEIVQRHFKYVTVQEAFEDLLEAEKNWNQFLLRLDQNMRGGSYFKNFKKY